MTLTDHMLTNKHLLINRDYLIDILTPSKKTELLTDSTGVLFLSRDTVIYVGKLLAYNGELYSVNEYHTKDDIYIIDKMDKIDARIDEYLNLQGSLSLKKGMIDNFTENTPIETTIGRFVLNYVILVEPFGSYFPYINTLWKDGDIGRMIVEALLKNDISVEQAYRYRTNLFFLGHFEELSVPSISVHALTTDPKIEDVKKKLIKEHKKDLENKDPVAMNKIEKTLIAMDKEYIKDDPSSGFYNPDSKSYDIHRKKTLLTTGMLEEFGHKGSFNFIERSLEEGIGVEDFVTMANDIRKGSYDRGKETALGGEQSKFLMKVFQNARITEDDCGTTIYKKLHITPDNKNYVMYRNIVVNGTLVTITPDNINKYIDRTVDLRSPMGCQTHDGYCFTCMGEHYRKTDQNFLTLGFVSIGSFFMLLSMKSMHGVQHSTVNITSLNKFVL